MLESKQPAATSEVPFAEGFIGFLPRFDPQRLGAYIISEAQGHPTNLRPSTEEPSYGNIVCWLGRYIECLSQGAMVSSRQQ
jgi:hypothetical protein